MVTILLAYISWVIVFQSLGVVGLVSAHARIEEERLLLISQLAICKIGNSHVDRPLHLQMRHRTLGAVEETE